MKLSTLLETMPIVGNVEIRIGHSHTVVNVVRRHCQARFTKDTLPEDKKYLLDYFVEFVSGAEQTEKLLITLEEFL